MGLLLLHLTRFMTCHRPLLPVARSFTSHVPLVSTPSLAYKWPALNLPFLSPPFTPQIHSIPHCVCLLHSLRSYSFNGLHFSVHSAYTSHFDYTPNTLYTPESCYTPTFIHSPFFFTHIPLKDPLHTFPHCSSHSRKPTSRIQCLRTQFALFFLLLLFSPESAYCTYTAASAIIYCPLPFHVPTSFLCLTL